MGDTGGQSERFKLQIQGLAWILQAKTSETRTYRRGDSGTPLPNTTRKIEEGCEIVDIDCGLNSIIEKIDSGNKRGVEAYTE